MNWQTLGWEDHGEVMAPGYVEDFRIINIDAYSPSDGDFQAVFVAGSSFGDLRLYGAYAKGPLGPVHNWRPLNEGGIPGHTRLYSGRVNERQRLITAVWPGLPKAGIWLFTERSFGIVKQLFIAPKDGTGYSVAAGNPAVAPVGDHYEIFFEGRADLVRWSLFHATWTPGFKPVVDDEPFLEGAANPSLVYHGDRLYLYHSRHAGPVFSTCAFSKVMRP